ncbi:MAG TPA: hypothetical protein VME42_06070 [Steroidobacteraceae bacterium]|nr:hypothetical protein [Steroidobacteraceae bacterium]
MKRTTALATSALSFLGWLALSPAAPAADSGAGQKTFEGICAACHKVNRPPYAGKSESQLETDIKGIVAGKIPHPKKLTLSADDIANVAAYIAANDSK